MKITFLTREEIINGFKEFLDRNIPQNQQDSEGGRKYAWNSYMGHLLYQDKIHGSIPYPFTRTGCVKLEVLGTTPQARGKQRKI